jgi:hypothetical protein
VGSRASSKAIYLHNHVLEQLELADASDDVDERAARLTFVVVGAGYADAVVLRDYLLVTRNLDPVALERGRMATVQQGWTPEKTALGLMAYAAFQELAPASPTATPAATPVTRWPIGSCCGWPPMRTCT